MHKHKKHKIPSSADPAPPQNPKQRCFNKLTSKTTNLYYHLWITHLYRCRVPIADIAWRGRWRQLRNLEYYLQEVAGTELMQDMSDEALDRISLFAGASDQLVQNVLIRGHR